MILKIETEIRINRPLDQLAAYLFDLDKLVQWNRNISQVDWLTPKPLIKGTYVQFSELVFKKNIQYSSQVMEYVPGKKLKFQTKKPFLIETTYRLLELEDSSTLVKLRNKRKFKGLFKYIAPLSKGLIKKSNKKDLQLLKEILENQPV